MNWFKRNLGLDLFDLLVHVTITALLIGIADSTRAPEGVLMGIAGTSLVILAIRRKLALKHATAPAGITSGEMAAFRFEEMESRLAELEASQSRVHELEQRLEFAERLLSQQSGERKLVGKGDLG